MSIPSLSYDELQPGREFAPWPFVISAEQADAFDATFRFDDAQALPPARRRILNPTLLGSFLPLRRAFDWGQGVVHAKETIAVQGDAHPGQPLEAVVSIETRYEKKGRRYADIRLQVRDAATRAPLLDVLRSLVWPD